MDCWKVLGIEATNDKLAIKEAYMNKLNIFHPEEDPEGFQNLRQAYESALKQCESEEEIDNSPLGMWLQEVKDVYSNFSKRIDVYYWEQLLQNDICFQIDSATEASESLLKFLMDNYRLPQNVWIALDNQFDWQNKKEELYKKFPNQFIDFIINEMNYKDNIKYDLFEADDDKDFDQWFRLFYDIRESLTQRDTEKTKELLDQIKSLEIFHPEMTVLEIRYLMQIEDFKKAEILAQQLVDNYPDELNFLYAFGQVELGYKNIEKAKQYFEKIIEINKDYDGAYIGLADCLLADEEFEEAQKYYDKMKLIYPYNGYIREAIYKCTEGRIKNYKKIMEENPDNIDNLYHLAWGYYDIDKIDESKQIVNKIPFQEQNQAEYYDLKGKIESESNNHAEALEFFYKWLSLEPQNDERLYVYKQISIEYYSLKKYNKALEYCDKILDVDSQNADILNIKADIYNILKNYNEAVYCCDKAIEIDNLMVRAYINRAEAFYNLGRYKEAMDNCFIVENIYPYFIQNYLIQIKVLYSVDEYKQALDIVNKVEELGVDNEEITLYKARILEAMDKLKEANDIYMSLIDKNTQNDLVYYYFACLCSDMGNYDDAIYYTNKSISIKDELYKYYLRAYAYKRKKRFSKALDDYDYIIEKDSKSDQAYNNRGLVYTELEDFKKAEADYQKAIELNPDNRNANNNMGEIYEKQQMYDKALEYYTKQLEIESGDYYFINRGWCYIKLKRYNEAQQDFDSAIKIEPKNPYAYNGLAHTYKEQGQYEEAVKFFKKAIEADDEYIYAYRFISECYEHLGKYDEAEQSYTKAIEKFPNDETLYLDRGLLYAKQKKYLEAIEDYQKAIELYPEYAYAYNNLGIEYYHLKQYDKAIEVYKKAIELYPNYANVYNNLGLVYEDLSQYKKAIWAYQKAIAIEPNFNKAYENLASLYLNKTKQYKKAIECYNKQLYIVKNIINNDNIIDIYKNRAEAYFKLGEMQKAQCDYKTLIVMYLDKIEKNKEYACDYENIAECYHKINDYEQAIKYYKQAIELAPKNYTCKQCHEAYYRLGEIEEARGNIKAALKYYKKANEIKPEDEEYKEAIKNLNNYKKSSEKEKNKIGLKKLIRKFKNN